MNNYLVQTESNEVKQWINTTLKKYISKNNENVSEIEHIIDYLNSNQAPKRLRKMSYVQALESSKKWLKSQIKKGNNIEESEDDTKIVKKWKDGMKLVKLVGENSFKREGFLMSHCVSSYYNKQGTIVYSLRDKNNKPHCTIEVIKDNNTINQIKGKGNGKIHPKYIKYVISILKTVFKMDVRDSEMVNLGYQSMPEGYEKLLKLTKTDYKTYKFNKKVYLYVNY